MGLQFAVHACTEVSASEAARENTSALPSVEVAPATKNTKQMREVGDLRERLHARLENGRTLPSTDDWELLDVANADEDVSTQVNDIVEFAYFARYSSRPPPLPSGASDRAPPAPSDGPAHPPSRVPIDRNAPSPSEIRRYALCATLGSERLVVLTMRFAYGGEMELFEYFDHGDAPWPHEVDGAGLARCVEVGRTAFHPFLDDCPTETPELRRRVALYRALAFRALWASSLDALRRSGFRYLYAIMAPHVARYFSKLGVPMQRVLTARLSKDGAIREIMNAFPRYWRPDGPVSLQPAAYSLGWELDVYSVPSGDVSIPVAAVPRDRALPSP